jgi:putative transcriptional regulator
MMIDYSPFWNILEKSSENWYTLTNKYHMSHSTLHRLKHNKDVSTKTLNDLCRILQCDICDLVKYVPSIIKMLYFSISLVRPTHITFLISDPNNTIVA